MPIPPDAGSAQGEQERASGGPMGQRNEHRTEIWAIEEDLKGLGASEPKEIKLKKKMT
jgi:hypothetical protein